MTSLQIVSWSRNQGRKGGGEIWRDREKTSNPFHFTDEETETGKVKLLVWPIAYILFFFLFSSFTEVYLPKQSIYF